MSGSVNKQREVYLGRTKFSGAYQRNDFTCSILLAFFHIFIPPAMSLKTKKKINTTWLS